MSSSILVTGGAGYIGSHVVKLLGKHNHRIVVLDNLTTGFSDSVLYGELIVGDVGNAELVSKVLQEHQIDTVLHFAAHTVVPESVVDPLKYYQNNTSSTLNLLRCCKAAGVKNFIFSSTAAVYGELDDGIATEQTPTAPINPYGSSKLMSEWMIRDLCASSSMEAVILRYFNVAGCDPEGELGQKTKDATLLIKVACEAAIGKREKLNVFGTDYLTHDGTCIRDYIHVSDLAAAHLAALTYLKNGGQSKILNCGYGKGFSVKDVIKSVERVNGKPLKVAETGRRAGDPPMLISDVNKISTTLEWIPQYDCLDTIVKSALDWEKRFLVKNEL